MSLDVGPSSLLAVNSPILEAIVYADTTHVNCVVEAEVSSLGTACAWNTPRSGVLGQLIVEVLKLHRPVSVPAVFDACTGNPTRLR